jgi:hypothetical protein
MNTSEGENTSAGASTSTSTITSTKKNVGTNTNAPKLPPWIPAGISKQPQKRP